MEIGDCSVSQRRFVVVMGAVYQIFTNGDLQSSSAPSDAARRERQVVSGILCVAGFMIPALTFLEAHKQHLYYKPLTFPEYCDALEANPLNLLDPLSCNPLILDAT